MNKYDLSSEVLDISELEENQVAFVEVICDPRSHRRDDGFGTGQVFENASWGIDFSENASAIRDDADVRLLDGFYDFLEILGAQVANGVPQAIIGYRVHD